MAESRLAFRPDVEGLRGIAVLLVVAFHAGVPFLHGGFVGVDVFFVISGFLITGLLVEEALSTHRIDFVRFYARRMRRLLPAAIAMTAAVLLMSWIFLSPGESQEVGKAGLATILFASNILFMRRATDYFAADAADNPLLHTWSLGVEEQFYIFWPAIVFVVLRCTRGVVPLARAMLIIMVASFALCAFLTWRIQPWAFFSMPARAWQFAVGAVLYLASRNHPAASKWVRLAGPTGMALIVFSAILIREGAGFPGVVAALPTAGTGLVLLAGVYLTQGVSGFLSTKPMQWLGRLSYAWYLWHWPALVFAGVIFPSAAFGVLAAVLVSLGLAWLSHWAVENPVRHSVFLVRRNTLSVAAGVAFTIAAGAGAFLYQRTAGEAMTHPWHLPLADVDAPSVTDMDCWALDLVTAPKECTFGDPASSTTVVLFGDSHAGQWLPALEIIARSNGWRVVTFLKPGCPAARVELFSPAYGREYHECWQWREASLGRIAELHPRLVILGSAVAPVARGYVTGAEWKAGYQATLRILQESRIEAVLVHDNPTPPFDLVKCLARSYWRGGGTEAHCGFPPESGLNAAARGAEMAAIRELRGARGVDLVDRYCSRTWCPAVSNGTVVYRDDNHLTRALVLREAAALERLVFVGM